MKEVENFKT